VRNALLVDGVYAIVVGILLLFPSLGASVFARPPQDPPVVSGWGTSLIGVGIIALAAASDVAKYGGLAWAFALGLLLSAINLVYFWATGAYTLRTVLAPIVINIVLAVWIWTARPKGSVTPG